MSTRTLQHNITTAFEQAVAIGLAETITRGTVQRGITVDARPLAIRTPFADANGTIHLQETYVDYLWALIYSLLVIQDEGIIKRTAQGQYLGEVIFDTPVLINAKRLFDWALSLRGHHTPWPAGAPTPATATANGPEKSYAAKANGAFIDAITFVLCHEFGHLVNGHLPRIADLRRKWSNQLTMAERAEGKEMEGEADNFAQMCLGATQNQQTNSAQRAVSLVMLQCANLLLLTHPADIVQSIHPDVDQRLLNGILYATQKAHVEEFLWCTAGFAAHRFDLPFRDKAEEHGTLDAEKPDDFGNARPLCLRVIVMGYRLQCRRRRC